jgi:hypothetical protein
MDQIVCDSAFSEAPAPTVNQFPAKEVYRFIPLVRKDTALAGRVGKTPPLLKP